MIGNDIDYVTSVEEALQDADIAIIVTEWEEIKTLPLSVFVERMKRQLCLMDEIVIA